MSHIQYTNVVRVHIFKFQVLCGLVKFCELFDLIRQRDNMEYNLPTNSGNVGMINQKRKRPWICTLQRESEFYFLFQLGFEDGCYNGLTNTNN